jgi:hypothetical protein
MGPMARERPGDTTCLLNEIQRLSRQIDDLLEKPGTAKALQLDCLFAFGSPRR